MTDERREQMRAASRRHEAKRRGTRKEYMRAWRAQNRERLHARRRERYERHKADELAKNAEYCKRNATRINANSNKRYAKNPEHFRAKVKQWQTANPEKTKAILKVCRARRRGARGQATIDQIQSRINFYGGRCAYCGDDYSHVDHVIALSRGGSTWPANLRPACERCNLRKHAKPWREWLAFVRMGATR